MRRRTVMGLAGAVLVIGAGAYTAFWWIAAGKVAEAAAAWRDSAHQQKIDVSWQAMRVTGYPLSFRLELADVDLKDLATVPVVELRAPSLSASVRPWNFHAVSLAAPDGIGTTAGPPGAPLAKLDAGHASGAIAIAGDGSVAVWLSLYQAKTESGISLAARAVHVWAALPAGAPPSHQDPGLTFAASVKDLTLPVVPQGLSPAIDDVDFGVSVMGAFSAGPLAQAATAWRDAGGTIELDHLHVRWGEMGINGAGTLALDNDLQPVGGFSGGVEGFDQLLTALVAAGRVKASDARVARLALAMLAKAGPDGRPEIATSFTIQNGEMFLGPAKLGKAPRIDW
jgi:hypothetical protein